MWQLWRARRKPKEQRKPVANTRYLQKLEAYQKALSQYRLLVRLTAVCGVLLIIFLMVLSMRPASKSTETPEFRNRDIVLCLDVSGSMTTVDAEVAGVFTELAKGFKGERIAMVVFDSSSATIFPLTNDYDFVSDMLQKTKDAFSNQDFSKQTYDIYTGVSQGEGSSLIGDGLASCVLRFDKLDSKRSRSIILATDNYVSGNQIVDLQQAGALAKQKGVRVYGLNPSDFSTGDYKDPVSDEYRQVVLSTEGDYYKFDKAAAVPGIITKINQQDATRFKGSAVLTVNDKPNVLIIGAVIIVVLLFGLLWRLGL
jgi:hypothetical protein